MDDRQKQAAKESKADKVSRLIVAIMTCAGALGLLALLYFPLRHLQ